MAAQTMLVRIKPYAPRRGHTKKQYTAFGIRFEEAKGWYTVNLKVAAYLKSLHMDEQDENSPFLFDVKTAEEAEEVTAAELKKEGKALPADAPVVQPRDVTAGSNVGPRDIEESTGPDVTTRDLRPARQRGRQAKPAAATE